MKKTLIYQFHNAPTDEVMPKLMLLNMKSNITRGLVEVNVL